MAIVMPSRDTSQMYLGTNRPWLSIYGTRIRPIPPVGSISKQPVYESSLLHRMLTDELLFEIFLRMSPYTLGRAMCVCRKWNYTIRTPYLWREACLKTWQNAGHEENKRILKAQYDGSWRKMWKQRPRIRCDGIYVSRNTYVRAGVTEWKITNPVHLVCYYRYIRFYPSGRFVYKNSSLKLRDIAKSMHLRASKGEAVYGGRYSLVHDQIDAAVLYPGLRPTVLRIRLRIRGTTIGANNRLDLLLLVTSGLNEVEMNNHEDVLDATENWQENETHNPDVPAVTHRRGLAPFVFVPFEEVQTSVLNAPVDTMDFFVPG